MKESNKIKSAAKQHIPSILNPQSSILMRRDKSRLYASILIYTLAVLASFLLSYITIKHYPVFNPDGLVYLKTANIYLSSGMRAAAAAFNSPLYSIILAWMHRLTGLSLLTLAYLFSTIFTAFFVCLFIYMFQLLGGEKKYLWVPAVVILICHELNHFRYNVIRGHGYWVFLFLSIIFLIRFVRKYQWMDAVLWSVFVVTAMLFRIEGIAAVTAAPLVVFFIRDLSWKKRMARYFQLNALFIVAGALLFAYSLGHDNLLIFDRVPGTFDVLRHLYFQTVGLLLARAHNMTVYVLTYDAKDDALLYLFFGMCAMFIWSFISNLSLTYMAVAFYAAIKRRLPVSYKKEEMILWIYMLSMILLLAVFFAMNMHLSNRYVFPVYLIALIYVPFGLIDLYKKWRERPRRNKLYSIAFPVVCLMMLVMLISSVHRFGPSKIYVYNASQWLRHNTPKNSLIYTNYGTIGPLSDRQVMGWDNSEPMLFDFNHIDLSYWNKADYLVLSVDDDHTNQFDQIEKSINQSVVKVFKSDKKENRIVIFKLK